MKKNMFLIAVLALLVTSCGFQSEETPLTENLVTYTAKGTTKGEILLGVKDKTGKKAIEIIPASAYSTITADDNVIVCNKFDGNRDVYTLSGKPVGDKTYASFNRIDLNDSTVYYTGSVDGLIVYYFPEKEVVRCDVSYMSVSHLYMQKDNAALYVYTFNGDEVWSIVSNDVRIIKDSNTEENIVAIPLTTGEGKKAVTTAILYTPEGKVLKKLNAAKWKAFQKKLPEATEIGSMKLYEMTVNVKKL